MAAVKWRGKWTVDFRHPDGTRVKRVSPVQTKKGAEEFERELRNDWSTSTSSSGSGSAPEKAATPFREFAVEWLKTYSVVNNKPSEVIAKESTLRVHLIPFFEKFHLHEITSRDIERYKAEKITHAAGVPAKAKDVAAKNGQAKTKTLSRKSINNHLTVLHKLLVTAEEWGLVEKVPRVRRLQTGPHKFDWLNAEESTRFLVAVEKQYPQWYALFLTALRTGLRRGELFALHWSDVDLVARTLTVRHSVFRGKLNSPKNGKERTVPLTSRLVEVLKGHRAKTLLKGDLVFPADDGTLSIHQDHVDRPLKGALKLAGLRNIRFHDLRHAFASQLVSAGRSIKEVQELLGHETIQMTMRYAHLAPERMRDAVESLETPVQAGPRREVGNIVVT